MPRIMVIDEGGGVFEEVLSFYRSKRNCRVEVYDNAEKALSTLRASRREYQQVVIAFDFKRPNDSFSLRKKVEEINKGLDTQIVYCRGPEKELRLVGRESLH